jgi:biotin carboxyl carrier protein
MEIGIGMDKKIFRKVSMERLSSPEQLDQMITVTNAKAWFIIIAVLCIFTAVIIGSVTGSLTTDMHSKGMLIKSGGTVDLNSSEEGLVSDIRVKPGDYVNKGDVVARLDQGEMVDQITDLSDKLIQMKKANADKKDITNLQTQIIDCKKKLQASTKVLSEVKGRVVEVVSEVGDCVKPGTAMMRIAREGNDVKNLIGVFYVPAELGKNLSAGMEARISPSTVKKEEYGYIMGRIVSISEYPVTIRTAAQRLGNLELAKEYIGNKACLEVTVDLVADSKTISGYQWSTLSGPPVNIANSTVCDISVVIRKQRPIEMVIPQMKNLFGDE